MKMARKSKITRREVLIGGAAALGGGLLGPLLHHLPPAVAQSLAVQAGQKRIYIAADDHTDYFWTIGETQYRDAFLRMIDYYLDLADQTAGNIPDHQSRWNCDGSFWIWVYEKNRTAQQFQRLINRIKDGHISFPMTPLVLVAGGAPAEAVLRGLYYAGSIERRYNLRVSLAVAMENQTLPLGLGMLWAGAGAKYSWRGICGCDSLLPNAWKRPKEIYWMKGLDGSRILMKWNTMAGNVPGTAPNQSIGGYAEAYNPGGVVEFLTNDPGFQSRYPYDVIGAFGKGWDHPETLTDEFVTTAKAKSNSSRRVIVSNEWDFFDDFEKTYGTQLSELTYSFGNEWDLYAAAIAELTGTVKRSVEKLRAAEAMAALVSLKDPGFMNGRDSARALAFMNMGLFWEHNMGMVGPLPWDPNPVEKRMAWNRRIVGEIKSYVDNLHANAAGNLGRLITKTGTNERFFAFNPLSWARTDAVDYLYSGTGPIHVVDLSSGQEVPFQFVTLDGQRYLRALASNVPAVGYKVFEIQPGAGQSYANAATTNGGVIENSFHKLTVANQGAITSWLDKQRGSRQMVRTINGRTMNDINPASGSGTISTENAGPVSVTLLVTTTGPLAHKTRVTLYSGIPRIDIRNEITQNFSNNVTWGFSMELNSPDVWHEELGAMLRAKTTTAGGHYGSSTDTTRYDWLTLNHFADMSGTGPVGITLSNADCAFMKLGSSTVSSLDTTTPQISVLAGGRVANGENGIPNQGGDSYFLQRFALQSHDAYNQTAAMKFAMEHQNPLVAGKVTGGLSYPETSFSLMSISNPDVLLWALKPADDGIANGIIARVWNMSNSPATFNLNLTGANFAAAKETTHIETVTGDIPFANGTLAGSLTVQQLKSYLIQANLPPPPPPRCKLGLGDACDYLPFVSRSV